MKIKVFCPNTNGKLEFSKEELEKMLNEAYEDGFRDGRYNQHFSPWYYTTTTALNDDTNSAITHLKDVSSSIMAATTAATADTKNTSGKISNSNDNTALEGKVQLKYL